MNPVYYKRTSRQIKSLQLALQLRNRLRHVIMFDTVALCYREIGANVGGAWKAGKKFE
jgi:hypothetical protein